MANNKGTEVIDFGAFPGSNEASVDVTGQTSISAGSYAEAYVMDDAVGPHTQNDHRYFSLFAGLTCGQPTAGVGFTIYARSTEKMQGPFVVRWVWVD
jgi:hypothetical protein